MLYIPDANDWFTNSTCSYTCLQIYLSILSVVPSTLIATVPVFTHFQRLIISPTQECELPAFVRAAQTYILKYSIWVKQHCANAFLRQLDSRLSQHVFWNLEAKRISFLYINNLRNLWLDDELGALIAREECYIHCTSSYISGLLVNDRIVLCMNNWKPNVLTFMCLLPWKTEHSRNLLLQ